MVAAYMPEACHLCGESIGGFMGNTPHPEVVREHLSALQTELQEDDLHFMTMIMFNACTEHGTDRCAHVLGA